MNKLATVVGARPQFIKAATVSRAISDYNNKGNRSIVSEIIIHTGQHYDQNMSDVFFEEMCIPKPTYMLGITSAFHGSMTGRMIEKLEEVLLIEKPDALLVYGDTNSTLAGAIAAAKLQIPIAHVEAGLRSFNFGMPEEQNRVVVDRLSTWLFCPTQNAMQNLINEGYELLGHKQNNKPRLVNVGDVMYDAAKYYMKVSRPTSFVRDLVADHHDYCLVTIHRAENTDDCQRLESIMLALKEIAQMRPLIFPLHPRTKKMLSQADLLPNNIMYIDPVGYFDMLFLLNQCKGVLTDSGGLQKEAYFFKKPCVILREETEWIELVEQGYNVIAGAHKNRIVSSMNSVYARKLDWVDNLYGDGNASAYILETLLNSIK